MHKATHLLENVLQRAPRHTPTLERLLDIYLGAGNDRRTAEISALLEQIHGERKDHVNTERFAGLRQRFQKVVGLSTEELLASATASAAAPAAADGLSGAPVRLPPAEQHASLEEFTIDIEEGELGTGDLAESAPSAAEFEIPVAPLDPEPEVVEYQSVSASAAPAPALSGEELDLSDEWEAMVQEVAEPPREAFALPEPAAAAAIAPAEVESTLQLPAGDEAFEIEMLEISAVEPDAEIQPEVSASPELRGMPTWLEIPSVEFELGAGARSPQLSDFC